MNHLLGASDAHVRADVPADVPARSANRRAGSWLVLIALGAASVLAACSSSSSSPSSSSEATGSSTTAEVVTTTAAAPGSKTNIGSLKVGDCYNDPATADTTTAAPDATSSTTIVLQNIFKLDCAQPHDGEVIAVRQDPAASDAAYPADLGQQVTDYCKAQFQTVVGIAYDSSVYGLRSEYPTAGTWPNGDRGESCTAQGQNGAKLTGSVKGTAK